MIYFILISTLCVVNFIFGLLVFKAQLNNTTEEHAARILNWFDQKVTGSSFIDFSLKASLVFIWPALIWLFHKSKNS